MRIHGNDEMMAGADGTPHTTHTTNPAPADAGYGSGCASYGGKLADITPMLLEMLDVSKPAR